MPFGSTWQPFFAPRLVRRLQNPAKRSSLTENVITLRRGKAAERELAKAEGTARATAISRAKTNRDQRFMRSSFSESALRDGRRGRAGASETIGCQQAGPKIHPKAARRGSNANGGCAWQGWEIRLTSGWWWTFSVRSGSGPKSSSPRPPESTAG